jgi:hypothetical protein
MNLNGFIGLQALNNQKALSDTFIGVDSYFLISGV